jgi:hypothetical protein
VNYQSLKNPTQNFNSQVAIASLSGMNKTGMQNIAKKNGKRSNSDNPMNRKQATKSIEVQ